MTWNYRLTAHESESETVFQIHEVYYHKNGEPSLVSVDEIGAHGETIAEVKKDLKMMKNALKKPIFSYKNFPELYNPGN